MIGGLEAASCTNVYASLKMSTYDLGELISYFHDLYDCRYQGMINLVARS